MPDEPTTPAAEAGTGGTGQAAPAPAAQPVIDWDSAANPYKTRFTGLQAKHQQELEKWQQTNTALFDTTEKLTKVTGDFESLNTQHAALKVKETEWTNARTQLENQFARLNTIATEFPDLLAFEKDGLLPSGTGDDLKAKLATFRAKLGELGKQQAADALAGASPATPTPTAPKSADDLWSRAKQALSEGKVDEYQKLYDEYVKAKDKK